MNPNSKKISQLDPLVTSDNADLIPIVDVSSGETKHQTKENLLKEVNAAQQEHAGDTSNPHQTGMLVQTVSGVINGSNTVFSISEAFAGLSFIRLNQTLLIQGVDYNVEETTITYLFPPPASLSGKPHHLVCIA